ncbi:MAG: hypothetical protein C5B50_12795 [Verrucomicrobia bacterium]|nr:MAG: hypothetical protein C5B50_12795 [Verrucomicrobiota bacterium]
MKPQKRKNLPQSAVKLVQKLLKKDEDGLEMLRMHDFPDDASAHDDELTERLYAEFCADIEDLQKELSKHYGSPTRKGNADTKLIPLNGVFSYFMWKAEGRQLFVAAHHEDRGIPIVLWLGTVGK